MMNYRSARNKPTHPILVVTLVVALVFVVGYFLIPLLGSVMYRGQARATARLDTVRAIAQGDRYPIDNDQIAIIRRAPQTPYGTFLINRGLDHGIEDGQALFADNIYIGTIASAGAQTSVVTSMSHPESVMEAIHVPSNSTVLLLGHGGNTAIFEAPREFAISEQDLFVLPGYEGVVVGVVEKIIFDERNPFQTVYVRSPYSPNNLHWVTLVPST